MTSLRLAFLNLIRRKIPTLIAVIAIAVSVAASGILLKLYLLSDARFSTLGRGGDAVIGAKAGNLEILLGSLNLEGDYPDFLPMKLFESMRAGQSVAFEDGNVSAMGYIRNVIPFVYFAQTARGYRLIGTDHTFLERPSYVDSLKMAQGQWSENLGEVIAGSEVANRLGLHLGDSVSAHAWTHGATAEGAEFSLKVVGILEPSHTAWDRALYSSLAQARSILEKNVTKSQSIWNADVLNYFLVYLQNDAGLIPLTNLVNKRTVGQVISVPREILKLKEITGTGHELGLFITILIMFLGGLSVAAMMITRFESMTVQLAVLRAIGYGKTRVAGWLLWEGFLLGLLATLIGALIDASLFPCIREFMGSALPPENMVAVSIFQSWPVWLTALVATTVAVFVPLLRLYRQDVHDALRA